MKNIEKLLKSYNVSTEFIGLNYITQAVRLVAKILKANKNIINHFETVINIIAKDNKSSVSKINEKIHIIVKKYNNQVMLNLTNEEFIIFFAKKSIEN